MTEISNKYIVFQLANQQYGAAIEEVLSIERLMDVTSLPGMPSFVKGIINLRGEITPIIDLKERLDISSSDYTAEAKVLIVKIGENKVGLIVDLATDVQDIDKSSIEPAPNILTEANQSIVKGIANLEDRILTLLSLKELFTSKEIEKINDVQ